jgi:glycosyltransferase involved in cell wall biosynthesis
MGVKTEKMKICFISHSAGKGGAERSLLELIDALREQGVTNIFVLLPSWGPLIQELENRCVVYRVVPYKWWMGKSSPLWKRMVRTLWNFGMVLPVVKELRKWQCDIVCTNTITVCLGALAAKLLGLAHVWFIHEFGREDHGLTFDLGERLSLWLLNHLSIVCIANSHAVAQKYGQYLPPAKLRVVYQAVTVPEGVPCGEEAMITTEDGIKCAVVGALHEGKRQEDAIRAVGLLVQQGVQVKLYIVREGDTQYWSFLQNLVYENGLENYVVFLGYTDNPFPIMKSVDVLLMCSQNEAFGRVTVEAMKLGKPVIGARSGGTIELIRDGFNGFLYTVGDSFELAEKIRFLYEHPEVRLIMGKNAWDWATKRFTREDYGREILKVFREVIGNPASSPKI